MKLRRQLAVSVLLIAVVAAVLLWCFYVPAHWTANRFVEHVYEGRIDEARAMVAADDLDRIPVEYWDDLGRTEFGEHSDYAITGVYLPFVNNELGFWLHTRDGENWMRDNRVLWVADGGTVRVSLTEFP